MKSSANKMLTSPVTELLTSIEQDKYDEVCNALKKVTPLSIYNDVDGNHNIGREHLRDLILTCLRLCILKKFNQSLKAIFDSNALNDDELTTLFKQDSFSIIKEAIKSNNIDLVTTLWERVNKKTKTEFIENEESTILSYILETSDEGCNQKGFVEIVKFLWVEYSDEQKKQIFFENNWFCKHLFLASKTGKLDVLNALFGFFNECFDKPSQEKALPLKERDQLLIYFVLHRQLTQLKTLLDSYRDDNLKQQAILTNDYIILTEAASHSYPLMLYTLLDQCTEQQVQSAIEYNHFHLLHVVAKRFPFMLTNPPFNQYKDHPTVHHLFEIIPSECSKNSTTKADEPSDEQLMKLIKNSEVDPLTVLKEREIPITSELYQLCAKKIELLLESASSKGDLEGVNTMLQRLDEIDQMYNTQLKQRVLQGDSHQNSESDVVSPLLRAAQSGVFGIAVMLMLHILRESRSSAINDVNMNILANQSMTGEECLNARACINLLDTPLMQTIFDEVVKKNQPLESQMRPWWKEKTSSVLNNLSWIRRSQPESIDTNTTEMHLEPQMRPWWRGKTNNVLNNLSWIRRSQPESIDTNTTEMHLEPQPRPWWKEKTSSVLNLSWIRRSQSEPIDTNTVEVHYAYFSSLEVLEGIVSKENLNLIYNFFQDVEQLASQEEGIRKKRKVLQKLVVLDTKIVNDICERYRKEDYEGISVDTKFQKLKKIIRKKLMNPTDTVWEYPCSPQAIPPQSSEDAYTTEIQDSFTHEILDEESKQAQQAQDATFGRVYV